MKGIRKNKEGKAISLKTGNSKTRGTPDFDLPDEMVKNLKCFIIKKEWLFSENLVKTTFIFCNFS